MSKASVATLVTASTFSSLFGRVRKPWIQETPEAWQTRHTFLTIGILTAHLQGELTVGIRVDEQRGNRWVATNIALEVDFGDREEPWETVLERIQGEPGLAVVKAVHDAGRELAIPPEAWSFSWSGGRSLHAWLVLIGEAPLQDAYLVAQAIRDGVDARIAPHGLHVCTAWPTNRTGNGKGIRLPWGRHRRTGQRARFVEMEEKRLRLRDPYPADAAYVDALKEKRLHADMLKDAATLALGMEPARPRRSRLTVPMMETADSAETTGERLERALPVQARRIARPCILRLVESGVPEGERHDVALLLRAELVHCGLTLEQAWPVYARYAAACTPPWPEADARRDLEANWEVTDPKKRHACFGRGKPSHLTRTLHDRFCIGTQACGGRRAEPVMDAWRAHLTTDARVLYFELACLEAAHCLRPGDGIHTTNSELMERCDLKRKRFAQARQDLQDAGLVAYKATGRPEGTGTAKGGRHSVYRRIIPVPDPPEMDTY